MTDIIMIPLTKLVESDDNVRRVNHKDDIRLLSQSVKSLGLLQSLVVRDTGKGKYAVIAGGRRLRALRLLAKAGDIEKNTPIPCRVIADGDNAAVFSLAENVSRCDLAVHEELSAFQRLIDSGEGPEAIAARFGVSPQHVARRLKLARVSPRLIEALKRDELSLDQLAALALVDDHAMQERAFFDAPEWQRTPDQLRAKLTQAHVAETDKLARFVGLDAYQAAGGAIVSDLFAEEDEPRWLADRDLLVRLAEAKLNPIQDEVAGEGWAWVEIAIDGVPWSQFPERVREQRRALSVEEEAEQEQLYTLLDETEDEAKIEKIEAAVDALASSGWNAEEVAFAGAVITLSHTGEAKVERGLVRADDAKALKALRRQAAKSQPGLDEAHADTSPPSKSAIPAKLLDELLAHKTFGLRVAIAKRPKLALHLLVFTLAERLLETSGAVSCLSVRVEQEDVSRSITRTESKAALAFAELTDEMIARLPADRQALWDHIASFDEHILLELLAVLIAPGIDLRRTGPWSGMEDRVQFGNLLCQRAELDMSAWWAATVESYFEHVRKDVLIDALKEVKPTHDRAGLEKASKKELLGRVKRTFKGADWLPQPLRIAPAAPTIAAEHVAVAAE